jgi:hypothetical protein
MLNTYCSTCSAVNQIGEEFCVGCGANLALQHSAASTAIDPSQQRTGHEWQPFQNPIRVCSDIGRFGAGSVLSSTLRIFFTNVWPIAKIVFVVVAPFEIFKALSLAQGRQDWQTSLLTLLLGAICNVLIAPALIYSVMKVLETGAAPGVNESFRWGLTKIGRVAICGGISWLLQSLAYLLCIIPGIIVSLTLALVYPIAILENESAEDVLRRSSTLTRGHRLEILIAAIGLALVVGAIGLPFALLLGNADWPPMNVVGGIIIDILEQSFTVFALVLYLSLFQTPGQKRSPLSLSN